MNAIDLDAMSASQRIKLEFGDVLKRIYDVLVAEARAGTTSMLYLDMYQSVEVALEQRVMALCHKYYRDGRLDGERYEREYWEDKLRSETQVIDR